MHVFWLDHPNCCRCYFLLWLGKSLSFLRKSMMLLCIHYVFLLGESHSALSASTTLTACVTAGFVRYLCLKKNVSDILSALMSLTCIMWQWQQPRRSRGVVVCLLCPHFLLHLLRFQCTLVLPSLRTTAHLSCQTGCPA